MGKRVYRTNPYPHRPWPGERRQALLPPDPRRVRSTDIARLPKLCMFMLEDLAGDWTKAQASYFGDDSVFDQIYTAK